MLNPPSSSSTSPLNVAKTIAKPATPMTPVAAPAASESSGLLAKLKGFTVDATKALSLNLSDAAHAFTMDAPPFEDGQVAGKNTCAAANHEMAIYEHNPKLHQAMADGLEKDGMYTMPNGEEIKLSAENAEWIDKQPVDDETKAHMRIQAALMDYANGGKRPYLMEEDVTLSKDGVERTGLEEEAAARLDALDGTTQTLVSEDFQQQISEAQAGMSLHDAENGGTTEVVADCLAKDLAEAQANGANLAVQLLFGDMKHTVTVSAVDREHDTITVRDASGNDLTMTSQEFADAFKAVNGRTGDGSGGMSTDTSGISTTPTKPRGGR